MMKNERYFRSRPLPTGFRFDDDYSGVATDPDGNVRNLRQERALKLEDCRQELTVINAMPPGRILDVGCGCGFVLSGVDPAWERHGQDVSKTAASIASRWCTSFVGLLEEANYPDAWFDAVVCYHVIEHVSDPIGLLREMRRVLKPGGLMVVAAPDFDSACARRFGNNYRMLAAPDHISLFSTHTLRKLVEHLGLLIEHVDFPYFDTRHFTEENLRQLFDTSKVSPPFYGNHMTFYLRRAPSAAIRERLCEALTRSEAVVDEQAAALDALAAAVRKAATRRIQCECTISKIDRARLNRFADIASDGAEGEVVLRVGRESDTLVLSIEGVGEVRLELDPSGTVGPTLAFILAALEAE